MLRDQDKGDQEAQKGHLVQMGFQNERIPRVQKDAASKQVLRSTAGLLKHPWGIVLDDKVGDRNACKNGRGIGNRTQSR
jgi:hypothetical protein